MKWHDDNPIAYDIRVPSSKSIYHDNIEIVKTEFKKKIYNCQGKDRFHPDLFNEHTLSLH